MQITKHLFVAKTILFCIFGVVSVSGRILSRCEFATALKPHLDAANWARLGDWVCAAVHLSSLDTSSNTTDPANVNSRSYGLFSANNLWWCADDKSHTNPGFTNLCQANCSEFMDENLSDDVRCALRVTTSRPVLFSAWWSWEEYCKGKNLDEYTYLDNCSSVTIQPTMPKILVESTDVSFEDDARDQYIFCRANGTPPPTVTWEYDKTAFPEVRQQVMPHESVSTVRLIFPVVKSFHGGQYKCSAKNFYGHSSQIFNLHVKPDVDSEPPRARTTEDDPGSGGGGRSNYGLTIGLPLIAIAVVAIVCVVAAIYFRRFFKKWVRTANGLTNAEVLEFMNGNLMRWTANTGKGGESGDSTGQADPSLYQSIQNQPYDKEYDIPIEKLRLGQTSTARLGEGQYGVVTKAEFNGLVVAVKAVKPNTDKMYVKALLSELKIMIYLGKHQNVVSLVGAVTSGLRNGELLIVVEYCEHGDLLNYLRSQNGSSGVGQALALRPQYQNVTYEELEMVTSERERIPEGRELTRWCLEIARGMEYLESKKVIHADLAARNVLLTSGLVAKITDFGLSRQLYDYTNYVKKQQAPLPWRHMAPESLRQMCFSSESDVWAFGVTMWELFSGGDVPYPGRSWSLDFVHELENGMRMLRPKNAPDSIYEIMTSCWSWNKFERPSFKTLVLQLGRLSRLGESETGMP